MKIIYKIALLVLLCGFVAQQDVFAQSQKVDKNPVQLQKLIQAYTSMIMLYVEDVDMRPLVDKAIRSMLAELDPHSSYLNAEEMKASLEMTRGEFGGIGVAYNIFRDTIAVTNIIPNGPSQKAGIKLGDRIVEVDGRSVVGVDRSEVQKLLRGERGSEVCVGVVRSGEQDIKQISITRDMIPVTSIDAAYKVDQNIGYVRVNRFASSTMREFCEAMAKLSGVKTLILDLRNNGGGLMAQAIEMADYFLPKGFLITSTEGRALPTTEYHAERDQEFKGRLIVMINENSASGSELLAGALQDWDRAIVIGRGSFGKGLVQREIPMADGSAIRITVARYHTPSGRVIQRPYELGHKEDYDKAHIDRFRVTADSVGRQDVDSLMRDSVERPIFKTMRLGREIYGGGGIAPDVMVEMDTTRLSGYVSEIVRQGVNSDFVVDYMDKNRDRLLSEYESYEKFCSEFKLSDEDMQQLVELAAAKNIEYNQAEYERSKEFLRIQLTAQLVQQLFSSTEFYRYVNSRDDDYFKLAMQLIGDWESLVASVVVADGVVSE